jgi:hypothetical protein
MNEQSVTCQTEWRRRAVRRAGLNGLDYLEVSSDDHRTLVLYFLGKAPLDLDKRQVVITGGHRVTGKTRSGTIASSSPWTRPAMVPPTACA